MKILRVKKRAIDFDEYVKRTALESDYETLIDEPTILVDEDDGEVKVIYDHLGDLDTSNIVEALKRIRYQVSERSGGLTTRSRILGYRPRLTMRGDFCSTTSMATEHPTEHVLVSNLAVRLEEYYKKYNPEGYTKHKKITDDNVKNSYRINQKSIFTSGIINKNNPLKYHWDTGNFNEVYSCMVVFKKEVDGGYLSLPEYNLGFKLPNNSVFFFDGQNTLHGVTPIKYLGTDSYRYSIVYYSLKQIWKCLEVDDELARIRSRKTKRERIRMNETMNESDKIQRDANISDLKKRKWKKRTQKL